jgi:hypothetical protein
MLQPSLGFSATKITSFSYLSAVAFINTSDLIRAKVFYTESISVIQCFQIYNSFDFHSLCYALVRLYADADACQVSSLPPPHRQAVICSCRRFTLIFARYPIRLSARMPTFHNFFLSPIGQCLLPLPKFYTTHCQYSNSFSRSIW